MNKKNVIKNRKKLDEILTKNARIDISVENAENEMIESITNIQDIKMSIQVRNLEDGLRLNWKKKKGEYFYLENNDEPITNFMLFLASNNYLTDEGVSFFEKLMNELKIPNLMDFLKKDQIDHNEILDIVDRGLEIYNFGQYLQLEKIKNPLNHFITFMEKNQYIAHEKKSQKTSIDLRNIIKILKSEKSPEKIAHDFDKILQLCVYSLFTYAIGKTEAFQDGSLMEAGKYNEFYQAKKQMLCDTTKILMDFMNDEKNGMSHDTDACITKRNEFLTETAQTLGIKTQLEDVKDETFLKKLSKKLYEFRQSIKVTWTGSIKTLFLFLLAYIMIHLSEKIYKDKGEKFKNKFDNQTTFVCILTSYKIPLSEYFCKLNIVVTLGKIVIEYERDEIKAIRASYPFDKTRKFIETIYLHELTQKVVPNFMKGLFTYAYKFLGEAIDGFDYNFKEYSANTSANTSAIPSANTTAIPSANTTANTTNILSNQNDINIVYTLYTEEDVEQTDDLSTQIIINALEKINNHLGWKTLYGLLSLTLNPGEGEIFLKKFFEGPLHLKSEDIAYIKGKIQKDQNKLLILNLLLGKDFYTHTTMIYTPNNLDKDVTVITYKGDTTTIYTKAWTVLNSPIGYNLLFHLGKILIGISSPISLVTIGATTFLPYAFIIYNHGIDGLNSLLSETKTITEPKTTTISEPKTKTTTTYKNIRENIKTLHKTSTDLEIVLSIQEQFGVDVPTAVEIANKYKWDKQTVDQHLEETKKALDNPFNRIIHKHEEMKEALIQGQKFLDELVEFREIYNNKKKLEDLLDGIKLFNVNDFDSYKNDRLLFYITIKYRRKGFLSFHFFTDDLDELRKSIIDKNKNLLIHVYQYNKSWEKFREKMRELSEDEKYLEKYLNKKKPTRDAWDQIREHKLINNILKKYYMYTPISFWLNVPADKKKYISSDPETNKETKKKVDDNLKFLENLNDENGNIGEVGSFYQWQEYINKDENKLLTDNSFPYTDGYKLSSRKKILRKLSSPKTLRKSSPKKTLRKSKKTLHKSSRKKTSPKKK